MVTLLVDVAVKVATSIAPNAWPPRRNSTRDRLNTPVTEHSSVNDLPITAAAAVTQLTEGSTGVLDVPEATELSSRIVVLLTERVVVSTSVEIFVFDVVLSPIEGEVFWIVVELSPEVGVSLLAAAVLSPEVAVLSPAS